MRAHVISPGPTEARLRARRLHFRPPHTQHPTGMAEDLQTITAVHVHMTDPIHSQGWFITCMHLFPPDDPLRFPRDGSMPHLA